MAGRGQGIEFPDRVTAERYVCHLLGYTDDYRRAHIGYSSQPIREQGGIVNVNGTPLNNEIHLVRVNSSVVAVQQHYPHYFNRGAGDAQMHMHVRPVTLIPYGAPNYESVGLVVAQDRNQTQYMRTELVDQDGRPVYARIHEGQVVAGSPDHIFYNRPQVQPVGREAWVDQYTQTMQTFADTQRDPCSPFLNRQTELLGDVRVGDRLEETTIRLSERSPLDTRTLEQVDFSRYTLTYQQLNRN